MMTRRVVAGSIAFLVLFGLWSAGALPQEGTPAVGQLRCQVVPADGKQTYVNTVKITNGTFGDKNSFDRGVWVGKIEADILNWGPNGITVALPPTSKIGDSVYVLWRTKAAPSSLKGILSGAIPAAQPAKITGNGISVLGIKVYDDQALQQALNAARSQLAGIQLISQPAIAAQIGALQGGTLSQSAFGLTVGTASTPAIQTTANTGSATTTASQGFSGQQGSGSSTASSSTTLTGSTQATVGTSSSSGTSSAISGPNGTTTTTQPTNGGTTNSQVQNGSNTQNQLQVTGPSTSLTSNGSSQTQTTGPSMQTVSSQAALAPTVPTLTPTTLTLPSTFSPGASAILNEQLQLTSEITGYELLLEGALSDHYVRYLSDSDPPSPIQSIRPRTTIGVPITIDPSKEDENAVAEVILTVHVPNGIGLQAPTVTAILPEDKTYNVAQISTSSQSIGGSVATQLLGVSAGWFGSRTAYYLVQAQDTVAMEYPADSKDPTAARFGWQMRPVLGQKAVTAGTRTGFAQLAFPELPSEPEYGWVDVTTEWREYDAKNGIVSSRTIGQPITTTVPFDIPQYRLNPVVGEASYEDNGDGTVTVSAKGSYLDGTFAKVGPLTFIPGSSATLDPSGMRFTLPAIQLATHDAYLVDRGGDATKVIDSWVGYTEYGKCLTIPSALSAKPAGSGLTDLTIKLQLTSGDDKCPATTVSGLVVVINQQVFGLRNAPFLLTDSANRTIDVLVPTGLLQQSRKVIVKRLLWGAPFTNERELTTSDLAVTPVIGQSTVVSQQKDTLIIALVGTNLTELNALLPNTATFLSQSDTGAVISVPAADVKDMKQIVLTDGLKELFLVSLPAPPSPASTAPSIQGAVSKGQKTITVSLGSEDFGKLGSVLYKGTTLPFQLATDEQKQQEAVISATPVTATAGTKQLDLDFGQGKTVPVVVDVADLTVNTVSH